MNATIRMTLGGQTNAQLGFQVTRTRKKPLLPRTWEKTQRLPNRPGQFDYGAELRERLFDFECCAVDCSTEEDMAEFRRTLAAHLVDDDGKPKELALSFPNEPAKSWTVRVHKEMGMDFAAGGTLGYFRLMLVAYDPFGYGSAETVAETVTANPQVIDVSNSGTVSTPPTITLVNNTGGAVTNPTLTLKVEV